MPGQTYADCERKGRNEGFPFERSSSELSGFPLGWEGKLQRYSEGYRERSLLLLMTISHQKRKLRKGAGH